MKTMQAVRIHMYGGPAVLKYEEAPLPKPGPGEALVRVHAAGVNPVYWKVRESYLEVTPPKGAPEEIHRWSGFPETKSTGKRARDRRHQRLGEAIAQRLRGWERRWSRRLDPPRMTCFSRICSWKPTSARPRVRRR
jgi:hypothetical protein